MVCRLIRLARLVRHSLVITHRLVRHMLVRLQRGRIQFCFRQVIRLLKLVRSRIRRVIRLLRLVIRLLRRAIQQLVSE